MASAISSMHISQTLKYIIETTLDGDKAMDINAIDLSGKSDIADFMIVASGRSTRHVAAMAERLAEKLRGIKLTSFTLEGMKEAEWVVVDSPHVMVHLFTPEKREHYELEKMWEPDFITASPTREMEAVL